MLYEKRKIQKFMESPALHRAVLVVGFVLLIAELLYVLAPSTFWAPIVFIDLVNVTAQLATAGAFLLGIHQYRRSKVIERQAAFVKECRDLIVQMQRASTSFVSSDYSYRASIAYMVEMNNHASNFNMIFKELDDDVHKAIVRMHWQNMYFGELTRAMESWDISSILSGLGVSDERFLNALVEYTVYCAQNPPSKMFGEYHKIHFLIDSTIQRAKMKDDDRYSFFYFQVHLFDHEEVEDLLHGTLNVIEPRVRAPVVVAVNEKFNKELSGIYKKMKDQKGLPTLTRHRLP